MRSRRQRNHEPEWHPGPTRRVGWYGVEMQVEPHRKGWYWEASYTFGGRGSIVGYSGGGTGRHPLPYTVAGTCRAEGEAWEHAREAADYMRQRIAALSDHQNRTTKVRAL